MSIKEYLRHRKKIVDRALDKYMPVLKTRPQDIPQGNAVCCIFRR